MKMMNRKITIIAFMLLSNFITYAQDKAESTDNFGIRVSAVAGWANFNYGNLNAVLENQGLPKVKDGLYIFKLI